MHDDISIHITVLFVQLWVLHVIITYVNDTSRMFPHSLVQLIVARGIVQIQSRSTSLGQILCGVKKQMLILLSSMVKYFLSPERVIQVQF